MNEPNKFHPEMEYLRGYNAGLMMAIDYHSDRAIAGALAGCNLQAQIHNAIAVDLHRLLVKISQYREQPTCHENQHHQPGPQPANAAGPGANSPTPWEKGSEPRASKRG